jgi:hypothetical protein
MRRTVRKLGLFKVSIMQSIGMQLIKTLKIKKILKSKKIFFPEINCLTFGKNFLHNIRNMKQNIDRKKVITALVSSIKDALQAAGVDKEILPNKKPATDYGDDVDSDILVSITGSLAVELGVDIPQKCQLFIGPNKEALTIDEVADRILEINEKNGSR